MLKHSQLGFQVLAADRNHVGDIKAARGQDLLKTHATTRRAAASATSHAYADHRSALDPGLAVRVPAYAAQAVQEGAQAFAEIGVVDRCGKDCGVGCLELDGYVREMIVDGAPSFRMTCPAVQRLEMSAGQRPAPGDARAGETPVHT